MSTDSNNAGKFMRWHILSDRKSVRGCLEDIRAEVQFDEKDGFYYGSCVWPYESQDDAYSGPYKKSDNLIALMDWCEKSAQEWIEQVNQPIPYDWEEGEAN